MWSSIFLVPPGDSTPLNTDSAFEPLLGSASRSIVATTSSATSVEPLWNFTPCAQREGPDVALRVRLPRRRQHRAQREVGRVIDQELAGLLQQHEAAEIGDGHRIDGARRHRLSDADRAAGLGGGARAAAASRRAGRRSRAATSPRRWRGRRSRAATGGRRATRRSNGSRTPSSRGGCGPDPGSCLLAPCWWNIRLPSSAGRRPCGKAGCAAAPPAPLMGSRGNLVALRSRRRHAS